MQDEILKHTEKIYKAAKNPEHNLGKKLKEILIEIFIIVFAVTLSIWLHGWSEHNHQKKEAIEFLRDIQDDISKDLEGMKEKKASLDSILQSCTEIINLKDPNDTSNLVGFNFSLSTFKANDGDYQGFKSSGKIGFIENKELKKKILAYYEKDMPALYDVDKYQYAKHLEVWELIASLDDKKIFANPLFKTKIVVDAQITEALIRFYTLMIKTANEILQETGKETGK